MTGHIDVRPGKAGSVDAARPGIVIEAGSWTLNAIVALCRSRGICSDRQGGRSDGETDGAKHMVFDDMARSSVEVSAPENKAVLAGRRFAAGILDFTLLRHGKTDQSQLSKTRQLFRHRFGVAT
jgi:hypothetical protein